MARLLQLSDLHVVAPGTLASGILDTPKLLRQAIDAVLQNLEAIGPIDAVLVTGDVSDDGSPESYKEARAQLERLKLPLLPIPGNHDKRREMQEAFSDLGLVQDDGPFQWKTDIEETRLIGLDTLVEGQGAGRLCDDSLSFLEAALNSFEGASVVVALHHPPIKTGIHFMDAIGLTNVDEMAAVLDSFQGELLVVSGHVHGVHLGHVGGHPVVTAPSICSSFRFDRRPDAPVGFNLGPTGYAVLDTTEGGLWSAIPLAPTDGLHPF